MTPAEPDHGPAAMRRFMREHPLTRTPAEPASWQAFHGVSGELIGAHHDEDGVMIRADFHGSKLAASTARDLARHLIACADLADDWMRDAADPGPELADDEDQDQEPAEYDPGPEVDDQGGMSEYRYHEPEPWQ